MAAGGADIRDEIIEFAPEEVTIDRGLGVFPGKYDAEAIETEAVIGRIGYESMRKKRFFETQNLFYFVFCEPMELRNHNFLFRICGITSDFVFKTPFPHSSYDRTIRSGSRFSHEFHHPYASLEKYRNSEVFYGF